MWSHWVTALQRYNMSRTVDLFQVPLWKTLLLGSPWLSCLFSLLCNPQGKEIIEYYLRELEDEGITLVPRWMPSVASLPPPRPTTLSTRPPDPPKLVVTPDVSAPLPTKDSISPDIKQDSSVLQADSLTETLAGTPEGLFLQKIERWIPALVMLIFSYTENCWTVFFNPWTPALHV